MRILLPLALFAAACGGTAAGPRGAAPASAAKADDGDDDERHGWELLDDDARAATAAHADAYARYLTDAKTARRAVRGLIRLARDAGARDLAGERPAGAHGKTFVVVAPGGDAAAFVRVGERPIEEGVRLVVASVDAPHFDLKQQPVFEADGLAMLDTSPYGDMKYEHWLSRPMALYLYAARPGAKTGAIELVVGESGDDPVLVIPDLLPHLSRDLQRKQIVDSPERMNAVAAATRARLLEVLAARGVDEQTLQDAEVSLVPAGPARFIGVDRALLAGYGHTHRALAFDAVRALLDADSVQHTAIVIVLSRSLAWDDGDSGTAFARSSLSAAMRALAADGDGTDALAVRRIYARSAALVAGTVKAKRNRGLALNPRSDDALPAAVRRAIDAIAAAGAQWQLAADEHEWASLSRQLGTLDLDVVEVGLPTTGEDRPLELLSTLDLYQGYLACRGWLSSL